MRYVLDDIEAEQLAGEMRRRGIRPHQRLHVIVETIEDGPQLAAMAEQGGAFAFLADEPDLYDESDIKPNG